MGNVDIYHSRRSNYAECIYWIRDERVSVGDLNQWIMKNKSNGLFYAREVSPEYNQQNPQANVFMFDKNTVTLETDDDVDELKRGCVVLYNGHPWIVDNVQRKLHRKESQFDIEQHYKTIVSIRR